MSAPEFTLPPCPLCSSIHGVVGPVWYRCDNVSRRDKADTYSLLGCTHAQLLGLVAFRNSENEWRQLSGKWKTFCDNAFENKTRDWTADRREAFREKLYPKFELPGQPDPEKFNRQQMDLI